MLKYRMPFRHVIEPFGWVAARTFGTLDRREKLSHSFTARLSENRMVVYLTTALPFQSFDDQRIITRNATSIFSQRNHSDAIFTKAAHTVYRQIFITNNLSYLTA